MKIQSFALKKSGLKKSVGPDLHDYFNDAFDYVVVTMTTPRTYAEDFLCHMGVKSVVEKLKEREIKRTYPGLNINSDFVRNVTAFEDGCTVDEDDRINRNIVKIENNSEDIFITLNKKGLELEKFAIVNNNFVIEKLFSLSDEEKKTGVVRVRAKEIIENLTVYTNERYFPAVVAFDKKKDKRVLVIFRSGKKQNGFSYEKPLVNNYTLASSYFETNIKKLIESDSERNKEILSLYDLSPISQELAAVPFYTDKRELKLFFCKRDEILLKLYPGGKLTDVKVNKNHCTVKACFPESIGKVKGLVLKYRSNTEEIIIPLDSEITVENGVVKIKADIDFSPDMPLKEIYWDVRAVVEKFGTVQLVKLKYDGIKLKRKVHFENCQCDVDDKHIIFPYFTKKSILCFCYRERSEYDTAKVRRTEFFAYAVYKLFGAFLRRKHIWVVYEKFCVMAQDNGYYFFKYCMENLPETQRKNIYYIIDKRSDEYKNVEKYASNVIQFMSFKHMLYILAMDICISSDSKSHLYAWRTKPSVIKKGISNKKELFLQHGVTALKQVHHLFGKKGTSPMTYFVTTGKKEQEIVVNELGYSPSTAPITGFARWDDLNNNVDKDDKFILLMPTWRSWLEEVSDEEFVQSDYFYQYTSLLKNERLMRVLEKGNTRLVFYIHPKFAGYIDNFKDIASERISYIPFGKEPLNDLMKKCSMLITDYSSVCWDVYYLDKPVLFYQFDYETYNLAHGSYINMETDLIGERSVDADKLISDIDACAKRGFEQEDKYKKMAGDYFTFRDNNNSKRIYEFLKSKGH